MIQKLRLWKDLAKDMKWVYGIYNRYLFKIVSYGVIDIIRTFVALFITYSIGTLVDYMVSGNMGKLISFSVFVFAWLVIDIIAGILQNIFSASIYTSMQKHLFMKLYNKILHSDWEHIALHHSGDLLTRLSKDVTTIAGNANGLIPTILSNGIMIMGSVAVIIWFDPFLLIIIILLSPFILFSTRIFMGKAYKYQEEIKAIDSEIMSLNKETFHNLQAVKAFGIAGIFTKRMEEKENSFVASNMKSNKYSVLSWAVTKIAGITAAVICAVWVIYRINSGHLSYGNVTSIAAMALRIATSASALLGLMPTILEFSASAKRAREIFDIPDEQVVLNEAEQKRILEAVSHNSFDISVENLSFHYLKGNNVFENVNINAHSGEIIALVGPSGEGKTTMLRILLGIIQGQQGNCELRIAGNEVVKMGVDTRNTIAYVPQGNTMMSGTIADNMRWIKPDVTDEEIIAALELSCAYDFVKKLPDTIYHEIGESGLGFSEGQNQRLAIARAILRNTPLLLLDEATSALDVATERRVLSNLMCENPNRIVILTTHRPSALNMCHKVYRIADKQVNEIGEEEITQLLNEF